MHRIINEKVVIDHILRRLPTLLTLGRTIRACKDVYAIFKPQVQSVVRAVVFNEFGPAAPQAVALALYLDMLDRRGLVGPLGWGTYKETDNFPLLTATVVERLHRLTVVIDGLEAMFSRLYKDRTGSPDESRLSREESLRFRRAMYRLMMLEAMSPVQPPNAGYRSSRSLEWAPSWIIESDMDDKKDWDESGDDSTNVPDTNSGNREFPRQEEIPSYNPLRARYDDSDHFRDYVRFKKTDEWDSESSDEDLDERLPAMQQKPEKVRYKYMSQFPKQELLELRSVSYFLLHVARWAHCASGFRTTTNFVELEEHRELEDIAAATGPSKIFQEYKNRRALPITKIDDSSIFLPWDNDMSFNLESFLSLPLGHALKKQGLTGVEGRLGPEHWRTIVDDCVGEGEACAQCGMTNQYLWSQSNWDLLRGAEWCSRRYGYLLTGELGNCTVALKIFRKMLATLPQDRFHQALFEELVQIARPKWQVGDPLCGECLAKFMSATLTRWTDAKLMQHGQRPATNCLQGWSCRLFKADHWNQLHHFCDPIVRAPLFPFGPGV